jgi:hypothetical protein
MGLHLRQLSPPDVWEAFARFVEFKPIDTLKCFASVLNQDNPIGSGGNLYGAAQGILEHLFNIIWVFGRHHWGIPQCDFTRDKKDASQPAKNTPEWLRQHLYREDVPARLYRAVSWERERKKGGAILACAYVAEHPGEEYWDWDFTFMFGIPPAEGTVSKRLKRST